MVVHDGYCLHFEWPLLGQDSSATWEPDLWLTGRGFNPQQKQWENFLFQSELSVLTLLFNALCLVTLGVCVCVSVCVCLCVCSVSYSIENWGSFWPSVLKSKGQSVKSKGQVWIVLKWVNTWSFEFAHTPSQTRTLRIYVQQKSYSRFDKNQVNCEFVGNYIKKIKKNFAVMHSHTLLHVQFFSS